MADYAKAIEMFVPDENVFIDSLGYRRKWLVLHKTAGGNSARSIARWFQSGAGGMRTSVHYVVGPDGEVVQCVREKDGAGGNCCLEAGADAFWPRDVNLNLVTFSIENVDPALDNSSPMPPAQKHALFALVKDLCTRQKIPMRPASLAGGITGHRSIAPRTRNHCPGNFPWNDLWSFLKQKEALSMLQIGQVSAFFVELEPGKRWRCKIPSSLDGKTYDIAYGLLDFYRTFGRVGLNGFTIFGLPTSGELHVPGTKRAVMQFCERGVMAYDPSHEVDEVQGIQGPCYPMHIDVGPAQDPRILALMEQVKQLQTQLEECRASPPVSEVT